MKLLRIFTFTIAILMICLFYNNGWAEFSPYEVVPASKGKQNIYVMDAIIRGGDSHAPSVDLVNVRWAKQAQFERLVFDISGEKSGSNSIPPYFQVGINPQQNKITIDIQNIKERKIRQFDINKVISKSNVLKSAYLAPKLQGELATIDFITKNMVDVEAFYLMNPPRIILDLRAKK